MTTLKLYQKRTAFNTITDIEFTTWALCAIHCLYTSHPYRGRILGRNPDKSLQSFSACYSQSPLQVCFEISISSNSRNFLQFLQFSYCVLYTVKEKGRNPDRKPYPLTYGLKIHTETWELSRLCPETSTKLYVHEFGFSTRLGCCIQLSIEVLGDKNS